MTSSSKSDTFTSDIIGFHNVTVLKCSAKLVKNERLWQAPTQIYTSGFSFTLRYVYIHDSSDNGSESNDKCQPVNQSRGM